MLLHGRQSLLALGSDERSRDDVFDASDALGQIGRRFHHVFDRVRQRVESENVPNGLIGHELRANESVVGVEELHERSWPVNDPLFPLFFEKLSSSSSFCPNLPLFPLFQRFFVKKQPKACNFYCKDAHSR